MINRIFNKVMMPLVAAVCLLPASGFASQIFSLGGLSGGSTSGTGSNETVMIDFNTLTGAAGTSCAAGCTGTNEFVETYSNNSGVFELTQSGTEILSWTNTSANIVMNNNNSINLYSTPTALTFTSAFLTELGLASSPTTTTLPVALQTFDVAILSTNGSVNSASTQMTLTSTPEPATFALFGTALLLGLVCKARKRLA